MNNRFHCGKRFVAVGGVAVLALCLSVPATLVLTAGVAQGAAAPKVTICHLPPGNPSNVQLITVGAPAVPQHVLLHGDAVCAAGNRDCCADPNGEVCTNLQSDRLNCGTCETQCPRGANCVEGTCACPAGDTICDGECANLGNDPNNCGGCGEVCPAGLNQTAGCSDGECTASCNTGFIDCDGTCVDPTSDPNHCGGCNTPCAPGGTCESGVCNNPPNAVNLSCICDAPCGEISRSFCTTSCPPAGAPSPFCQELCGANGCAGGAVNSCNEVFSPNCVP